MGFAIAGAAVAGLAASSISSSNATNAENNASNNALGLTQSEFNTYEAQNAPWVASGQNALSTLNSDLPSLDAPFTTQDFQESPGYQFQLGQGELAMQRSAASSGILDSVGTVQNLGTYAQGMANTDYQTALNNYMTQNQQKYNMLAGLAGNGQTAVSQLGQIGGQAASTEAGVTTNQGNAQAAGSIASGNAINGTLGNLGSSYTNYSLLNNLFGSNNGMGGGQSLGAMPQIGGNYASAPNYSSSLGTYDF